MQDFRNLRVWLQAHQLAINAYALAAYLQEPKGWPLRDQILKAAISIPSNIAEGTGRGSDADFCRFLWYSVGSCQEFESDLLLGRDVRLIPGDVVTRLGNEVSSVRKTLIRLIQTVDPGQAERHRG
jgi:four helix bundle protein